jgi:hypothetical protein
MDNIITLNGNSDHKFSFSLFEKQRYISNDNEFRDYIDIQMLSLLMIITNANFHILFDMIV